MSHSADIGSGRDGASHRQGREGQILVQGTQSTCQGSKGGKDHEQNFPGATGRSGGGGAAVPPGEPQSDVPTGKSGQSPVSPGPQGLGQMGFQMPKPNALPAHVEPCWVGPWPGTRSTKGWDTAKGLEPGPPEQAVLSSCHSARPCQASRRRPAGPYTGGLACSLAKLLLGPQAAPGPFGERPCPQ